MTRSSVILHRHTYKLDRNAGRGLGAWLTLLGLSLLTTVGVLPGMCWGKVQASA